MRKLVLSFLLLISASVHAMPTFLPFAGIWRGLCSDSRSRVKVDDSVSLIVNPDEPSTEIIADGQKFRTDQVDETIHQIQYAGSLYTNVVRTTLLKPTLSSFVVYFSSVMTSPGKPQEISLTQATFSLKNSKLYMQRQSQAIPGNVESATCEYSRQR